LRVFFNPFKSGELWVSCFGNGLYTNGSGSATNLVSWDTHESTLLYPNPASNTCLIELPDDIQQADILIFDMTGKLVCQKKNVTSQESIDIHSLRTGIYMAEIMHDTYHVSKKLKIIR